MFKRRKPLTLLQTAKQIFWPAMGWKRSVVYIKHRLIRLSDTSHSIALGLAIGFGISFTPLLGTHFIQAGLLALIVRGNAFAAMIGTFIGNPWTFPFFWWAGFSFGSFLFTLLGLEGSQNLPEKVDLMVMKDIFMNEPLTLFMPWMLGGYILAFISMPFAYFVYFQLVSSSKIAREKALLLRQELKKKERHARKKQAIKFPKSPYIKGDE